MAAVLSALEAGADGAEVDARLSADGTVVLHHDAEIGPADVEAGCAAPEGTAVFALADAALRHLATLAELLSTSGGGLPPCRRPAPAARPSLLLNIELKDLPGEPGWDGRSRAGPTCRRAPPRPAPVIPGHRRVLLRPRLPSSFRRHAPAGPPLPYCWRKETTGATTSTGPRA